MDPVLKIPVVSIWLTMNVRELLCSSLIYFKTLFFWCIKVDYFKQNDKNVICTSIFATFLLKSLYNDENHELL